MRIDIKLVFLVVIAGLLSLNLEAQAKFWVPLSDTSRINSIYDIEPVFCSNWLSQCSYDIADDVPKYHPVRYYYPLEVDAKNEKFGFALDQIGAAYLWDKNLNGNGIKIGIIDGGFMDAPEHPSLAQHFDEDRVLYYKDFITPDLEAYKGSKNLDDGHGTQVWALIGGQHQTTKIISGLATKATFYLARTDHGGFERRLEEDMLIKALEEFHEQGVRLVNISLGYSDGYSRNEENYTPDQMDGQTTMLAKAIDTAFYAKDMLVVVAAGNEGNRPKWKVLSTPADAKGALSVGATVLDGHRKMRYSSIGTPGLSYLKPEVSCFASNGTSFSAPIITGFAAALWESMPDASAKEIKQAIMASSSLYPYGNNYLGQGIPNAEKAWRILHNDETKPSVTTIQAKRKYKGRKESSNEKVLLYHKNSLSEVTEVKSLKTRRKSFKVRKMRDVFSVTVLIGNEVREIVWKQ